MWIEMFSILHRPEDRADAVSGDGGSADTKPKRAEIYPGPRSRAAADELLQPRSRRCASAREAAVRDRRRHQPAAARRFCNGEEATGNEVGPDHATRETGP